MLTVPHFGRHTCMMLKKNPGLPKLLVVFFMVCSRGWRIVATRFVVGVAFRGASEKSSRHCGIVMTSLLKAVTFVEVWGSGCYKVTTNQLR